MTRLTIAGARLVVCEVEAGTELQLYRIVRGDQPDAGEFLDSFRSHYELGARPRKLEQRSAVIHMGLSTYRTLSQAASTARRFPVIGTHTARLRLMPGRGLNFADTGHPGHVTIWGDPLTLAASVVDIQRVAS